MRALLVLAIVAAPLHSAEIPRPAPELAWRAANGLELRLDQYRGKIVAIEFLLTTCPHCQRCSRIMQKLLEEYGPRGFQPLGIAINEMSHLLVEDYIKDLRLAFPVGFAARETALEFLQHSPILRLLMPQLVFIDRKGVIRAQYAGDDKFFLDEEKNMRAQLELLLKEAHRAAERGPDK